MRTLRLLSALAVSVAVAAQAYAGTTASTASTAAEKKALESARNRVAAQATLTKGAAQQSYDLERRRLDDLIDALKSGRAVSPADIDRALEQAGQLP